MNHANRRLTRPGAIALPLRKDKQIGHMACLCPDRLNLPTGAACGELPWQARRPRAVGAGAEVALVVL